MRPANICIPCKGSRALCGLKRCPKLASINIVPQVSEKFSTSFFGPSPSVFIGRIGYPNVFSGPMGMTEDTKTADSPPEWFGMDYTKIVEFRSTLLRSKSQTSIFNKNTFIDELQEIALASKPTDVEMDFKKKPFYRVSFSDMVQPMGPTATLERMKITENPKISRKVDYIVNDEMKSVDSAFALFEKTKTDIYKITTILSAGILGIKERKKLVPTRWSITATDDILTKKMISEIKQFDTVNEYLVYESNYLDNHFVIILMPGSWEFENFEAWAPGSFWSESLKETAIAGEYEPYAGRTKYADQQGGGYYAARFGVVEALRKMRRQARVVSFREIHEGYVVPLGVWVVRETARRAFMNKPVKFNTREAALKYANERLRITISEYSKKSKILKQRRITDF